MQGGENQNPQKKSEQVKQERRTVLTEIECESAARNFVQSLNVKPNEHKAGREVH